jgi:hypothetical protein
MPGRTNYSICTVDGCDVKILPQTQLCPTHAALKEYEARHTPPVPEDEELRHEVTTLLADDWACTRVWEAWNYGTMTQDDFEPLNETERVDELLALIHRRETEARIDERNIAIQELRDELGKVRKNKALTPEGIDGYWSAIRDFSLNNGDRLGVITSQLPTEQEKE